MTNQDNETKRDFFAAMALNGMLAHPKRYEPRKSGTGWHEAISEEAYEIADQMIKVGRRAEHIVQKTFEYPTKCQYCNSVKIIASDECEKSLSFYCDRCNQDFEVEKTEEAQNKWFEADKEGIYCDFCDHPASIHKDGYVICHECEFNSPKVNSKTRSIKKTREANHA